MPNGTKALADEVTLKADLSLVRAAEVEDPRHLRQPAPRLVQHPVAAGRARSCSRPGDSLELWEGLREVPPHDQDEDVEPAPQAVADLPGRSQRLADAVLFAIPEYNSSIPGALKNALDWASRPIATNAFRGKPVAVIGSSIGMFGAVWAQADLRKVLAAMGARVADVEIAVGHANEKFDEDGRLLDSELLEQLEDAVATLLAATEPAEIAA